MIADFYLPIGLVHVMLFGVHSLRMCGWTTSEVISSNHLTSYKLCSCAATVEVWLHPMVFDLEKEKVMVRRGFHHLKLTM